MRKIKTNYSAGLGFCILLWPHWWRKFDTIGARSNSTAWFWRVEERFHRRQTLFGAIIAPKPTSHPPIQLRKLQSQLELHHEYQFWQDWRRTRIVETRLISKRCWKASDLPLAQMKTIILLRQYGARHKSHCAYFDWLLSIKESPTENLNCLCCFEITPVFPKPIRNFEFLNWKITRVLINPTRTGYVKK
jgi:hypothetical protein